MTRKKIDASEGGSIIALPSLPSALRYYDDFFETYRSINNISDSMIWVFHIDGGKRNIDFSGLPSEKVNIVKLIAVDLAARVSPITVIGVCSSLIENIDKLSCAISMSPYQFREYWMSNIVTRASWAVANHLRIGLHAVCRLSLGGWNPDLETYVSQLPSPQRDIYRVVRTGECFIPMDDQSLIVDYLDSISEEVRRSPESASLGDLREACICMISHQYGRRPNEISRLKIDDVIVYGDDVVHISIISAKQRGASAARRNVRKIKREWSPIIVEYKRRREKEPDVPSMPSRNLFNIAPSQVSNLIRRVLIKVTGEDWGAGDMRHSAAQRLADAGASHVVISEFLGHATTLTANVYVDASPTQADRINKALSISPIYSVVSDVARTKTIDMNALLGLPEDRQIGGVPHGVPISGIGACNVGQSLCARNPVISCYTCRKFLPVSNAQIHESVIESLRAVVGQFISSSRGNEHSPAFTQLRMSISAVQLLIKNIKMNSTRNDF